MAEQQDPVTVSGSTILGHMVRPDRDYRVKVYDFKRPDKFSLEQIRTVQFIHETIGRLFSPVLSGIVGKPVEVRCRSVDQLAFYEFFPSIPEISAFIPVSMPPLRGSMLMQIDGSLANLLVRRACGAHVEEGAELATPSRKLTDMECVVLRDVTDRLMPAIDDSWRNVTAVNSSVVEIGTDPQYVQIVPPTEMIILGQLEVTIGESSAFINFAIPYITIEPIIGRLSAQYWYSHLRRDATPAGSRRASAVTVDVELFAEAVPVRLADLPAVAGGALLELPGLAEGTVTLAAGGVPIAELAVDPARLCEEGALKLGVTSSRAVAGDSAGEAGGTGLSLPAMLSSAVDSLTEHIREVRRAVDEIRDDRESMLADLADPATQSVGGTQEPELDRRHHNDIAIPLAGEHPATIGFIIAGLSPQTAAAVLSDLDADVQPEVVRAIVALSDGDRALHRKLLSFVGRRITRSLETMTSGGPSVVAEILNNTPRSVEKHVMETFLQEDKEFFEEIAKLMFVFEDFVLVDQIAIRKLAARVAPEELALAMKATPAEVARHIMSALDEDLAREVGTAIDNLGRVRRQDVEAAQRDMIEELRQLEKAGEVVVARPEEVIE